MMTSPRFTPIRRRSGPPSAVSAVWIATAHSTAATADANSTNTPSPISFTIRPAWSATIGSNLSRRSAFSAISVPALCRDISRE